MTRIGFEKAEELDEEMLACSDENVLSSADENKDKDTDESSLKIVVDEEDDGDEDDDEEDEEDEELDTSTPSLLHSSSQPSPLCGSQVPP